MPDVNPFPPADEARHQIWEMLVRRDIEAFVAGDWDAHFSMHASPTTRTAGASPMRTSPAIARRGWRARRT